MSWRPGHDDFVVADEPDFIIPDEEPAPKPAAAPAPARAPEPLPTSSATGFPWIPSVDLSSAFAPFMNPLQGNAVDERRYTGGDTLDEPVLETLRRDLGQIGRRVAAVVWPLQLQALARTQQARLVDLATLNGLRLPASVTNSARSVPAYEDLDETEAVSVATLDWDMWGPLIFSLAYAVTMGVAAPAQQANVVFSGTFSFMWLFYLVVGLNIQLLGGLISFLAAISATGYLVFPIVVGALVSTLFLKWRFFRLVLMAVFSLWSIYAANLSLKCLGVLPGRVFLAIYPVGLMYVVLLWLVVIT